MKTFYNKKESVDGKSLFITVPSTADPGFS